MNPVVADGLVTAGVVSLRAYPKPPMIPALRGPAPSCGRLLGGEGYPATDPATPLAMAIPEGE